MASIYATTHNEAMNYIFDRLETYPRTDRESVVMGIYGDFCTERGIPFPIGTTLPTFPEDFKDVDLFGMIQEQVGSEALQVEGRKLVELLLQQLPYNPFEEGVKALRKEAKGKLNADDFSKYNDAAAVALQSHQLYISESGDATDFVAKAANTGGSNGEESRSINWWKVGGCDLVGGLVSGGAGALGASAISVIMQW